MGIKKIEQFVNEILTCVSMFFCILILKYLYDWRFQCIALLHKLKLTRTRQIIDLEQVWYMYSIVLPYCREHAWRNMAVWVVSRISLSLHSAYTHTAVWVVSRISLSLHSAYTHTAVWVVSRISLSLHSAYTHTAVWVVSRISLSLHSAYTHTVLIR